jgi:hypothetical protein
MLRIDFIGEDIKNAIENINIDSEVVRIKIKT